MDREECSLPSIPDDDFPTVQPSSQVESRSSGTKSPHFPGHSSNETTEQQNNETYILQVSDTYLQAQISNEIDFSKVKFLKDIEEVNDQEQGIPQKSLCYHLEESQIELLTFLLQKERDRNKTLEKNMEELKKDYNDMRGSSFKVNDSRFSSSSGSMHIISDERLTKHTKREFMDGEVKQHMVSAREFLDQFHQNQTLSPIRLGNLNQGESTVGSTNAFFTKREREPSFGVNECENALNHFNGTLEEECKTGLPLVMESDSMTTKGPDYTLPKFDLTGDGYTIDEAKSNSRREDTILSENILSSRISTRPPQSLLRTKPPHKSKLKPEVQAKKIPSNTPSQRSSTKKVPVRKITSKLREEKVRLISPKRVVHSESKSKGGLSPSQRHFTPSRISPLSGRKSPLVKKPTTPKIKKSFTFQRFPTQTGKSRTDAENTNSLNRPNFHLNLQGLSQEARPKHKFQASGVAPKANFSRIRELANCTASATERSESVNSTHGYEKPRTLEQLKQKIKGIKGDQQASSSRQSSKSNFKPFIQSPGKKAGLPKYHHPPAKHVKLDLCIRTDLEEEKTNSRKASPAYSLKSAQISPKYQMVMKAKNDSARTSPKVSDMHDLKKLKRVERWGTPTNPRREPETEEQKPQGYFNKVVLREPKPEKTRNRVIKKIKTDVEAKIRSLYIQCSFFFYQIQSH